MSELNAEELFHLAIVASRKGDHEKAILHLKTCVDMEPSGKSLYLLGAEYAEIGMYARAFEVMCEAIVLEPELWMAHFHAGLVQLVLGNLAAADSAWKSLEVLGDSNPLVLFKTGLLEIETGSVSSGVERLKRGILLNKDIPELNRDMERVLENVQKAIADAADTEAAITASDTSAKAVESEDKSHLFLTAYRNRDKS